MTAQKRYFIIAIVASTLLITYLHYSTNPNIHALHNIYRELYYIPVLLGALVFGLKGAILVFLFVCVLYLPYIFANWTGIFITETNRFLHLLLQGLFAIFAGFLIDRDRRRREQLEKERYLAGIGQAAATIVHDLKNPIVTILGFAQRIHEGKGNIDAAIQTIIDSAKGMQKIVYDVLDFAKPIQLVLKEDEDIKNIINRACNSCKTKVEEKGIDLLINLPDNPINIAIDEFHMEKAIVNLIDNAIEASIEGQVITINRVALYVKENYTESLSHLTA
jgi:signal transduction histidine kinase